MEKINFILHITTFCNYNCSYCDVLKDKRTHNKINLNKIIKFIDSNNSKIDKFKFFWGEPLLAFNDIKYIIDNTKNKEINYELVTNTSLLNDEVWIYFEKKFKIIFFSIDSENEFNYIKVKNFILKYNLKNKLYFNLVISPWKHEIAYEQFKILYELWFRNFNLLPVYYTKIWGKQDLLLLWRIVKKILDKSITDKSVNLYWFQDNLWYKELLTYDSIFIDIDTKIYFSDFVVTKLWKIIKKKLYLWEICDDFSIITTNIIQKKEILSNYEKTLIKGIIWQFELHKLMDYFSIYLNNYKWITKD